MIEVTPQEAAMWREMDEQQREWEELWDMVAYIEEKKNDNVGAK